MRGRWTRWILPIALTLLAAPALVAQTTGRIEGRVVDQKGKALPGVTITATSPNLQGSKVVATNANGEFRLVTLPPGTYKVKATLEGFNPLEQTNIFVSIDTTVSLSLQMQPAFAAELVVTGAAPIVDTKSSSSGMVISSKQFNMLPFNRNYLSLSQAAPGVLNSPSPAAQAQGVGAAVAGSTGAENSYVIDGMNTTGANTGVPSKRLNTEFIQEVDTRTGGLPAEYGRMTGGVISAVTKSGGNTFHGDVFGYYEGGSLISSNKTGPERTATTTQVNDLTRNPDYGLDLGGYFIKDKLWFFAAYDRIESTTESTIILANPTPGSPVAGSKIPTDTTQNVFAGKLTWKLNSSNSFNASIWGDPGNTKGAIFTIRGPDTTWKGTNDTGGNDYVAHYDGVFGTSWIVEAMVGLHHEKSTISGPGTQIPAYIDYTEGLGFQSGGFGYYQNEKFDRNEYKGDVSKFLGNHEIKAGIDYQNTKSNIDRYNGGLGQRIYIFKASDGTIYYRHRYYVNDQAAGYNRNDPSTWQLALPLTAKPNSLNEAAYIQDKWTALPNLTISLGVRYAEQTSNDRFGKAAFKLKNEISPRIGFAWDVMNNGRSKLYANYGRYYEDVPQDINIRSFGGEVLCFCYNYSRNPNDTGPIPSSLDPNNPVPRHSVLLGGAEPVDPNLKGQYVDEYLLGYQYEIMPNFAIGIQGTYRNLGRVIEDFLILGQGYFVANPGAGIGKTFTFYDYTTAPTPKAKRTYKAIELTANKRFSNNWQMFASYVWSKLDGNYDGTFQNSTGQLDPNINSAFDYADFLINADGKLSNDRTSQFKAYVSYQFPNGWAKGLNIGVSAYYLTGTPLTAYGYSFAYQNWEYYLTPRGSLGRTPADYEADLHLSYPIHFGNGQSMDILVDAFNVLNRQSIILYDQRYNLATEPCAGIPANLCNGDGGLMHQPGSIQPVGQLQNPRATATNPSFLKKGIAFTAPRTIRLGLRYSF